MRTALPLIAALATLSAAASASAQSTPTSPTPANEQVVVPDVARRDIKIPKYPSKDIEVGAFTGTYATENFGASWVYGIKLGYHITEDFFVQAALAQTKVSDETFRQILPGGVFTDDTADLTYYNISVGYNILPGEVFIGTKRALPMQLYVIAGVGSTDFNDQTRQTINIGFGTRVFVKERWSVQVDLRDHIFSLDLLGKRQSTQNLELTAGISYFF